MQREKKGREVQSQWWGGLDKLLKLKRQNGSEYTVETALVEETSTASAPTRQLRS